MRTTVNIDDGLLRTTKQRAEEEGRTLGELVEVAVRHYLAQAVVDPSEGPPLPVFDGVSGLRPGIDPTSNASMLDAVEAEEIEAYRTPRRGDVA